MARSPNRVNDAAASGVQRNHYKCFVLCFLAECLTTWGVTAEPSTSTFAGRLQGWNRREGCLLSVKSWNLLTRQLLPTYKKIVSSKAPYARHVSVCTRQTDEALRSFISHADCHTHSRQQRTAPAVHPHVKFIEKSPASLFTVTTQVALNCPWLWIFSCSGFTIFSTLLT